MPHRRIVPSVLLLAAALGCESTHEYFDVVRDTPDVPDAGESGDGEEAGDTEAPGDGEDGGPVTSQDCGSAGGVSVEGVVTFTGAPPATSRLYVSWMASLATPSMPLCMMEITPVAFPARFRFTGVERGAAWALVALLDADGGSIPMPVAGDYLASIAEGTLDLSADVSGVVLDLQPYAP